MDTKQLLELLKFMLEKDIKEAVSKDDYLKYATSITGDLKRIYYIDQQIELLDKNINIDSYDLVLNKIKKLLINHYFYINIANLKDDITKLNDTIPLNQQLIIDIKNLLNSK